MTAPEREALVLGTVRPERTRPSQVEAPSPAASPVGAGPTRRRFTELDGLRGFAALLVVFFHLRRQLGNLDLPPELMRMIGGADLMVDLFFVLSGFVLARTMLATTNAADVVRFGSLRARRFMPLHLAALAVVFGCALVTWLAQQSDLMGGRAAFSTPQQSAWGWTSAALLLQGFVGPHLAGYNAAWSLSIELYTNIALVVAIALVPWGRLRPLIGPLALVTGAVILTVNGTHGENSMGWTALGRGLAGLGAGLTVFLIYTAARRWPRPLPDVGAAVAVAVLLVTMYGGAHLRSLDFLPMIPVSALLILSLVEPSTGPVHRLMNCRPAQWLGSRSFALYALHGSILIAVALACRAVGLDTNDAPVSLFVVVTTVAGALVAAELGHRHLERLWLPGRN